MQKQTYIVTRESTIAMRIYDKLSQPMFIVNLLYESMNTETWCKYKCLSQCKLGNLLYIWQWHFADVICSIETT